jgi:glyoxylase-like metal-dependent hydrolase (beta-lactamase superfamily II)
MEKGITMLENKKKMFNGFCAATLGAAFTAMMMSGTVQADDDDLAVDDVEGDLSIMVLGSGGPVATPEGRASAGYMIFADGKPRILMDVGGGTYKSLAMGGVNVKDLDLVLLTHLHVDHTSDLSARVKRVQLTM